MSCTSGLDKVKGYKRALDFSNSFSEEGVYVVGSSDTIRLSLWPRNSYEYGFGFNLKAKPSDIYQKKTTSIIEFAITEKDSNSLKVYASMRLIATRDDSKHNERAAKINLF